MQIEQYMHTKAQELRDDYPKNGCQKIAAEAANALIEDGKKPEIITFQKIVKGQRGTFLPVRYYGIEWGEHHACRDTESNTICDPMLGEKPVSAKEYSHLAFNEDIPFEISFPASMLKRQIDFLLSLY